MKSRSTVAYLAASLSMASLYLMGAGANYPYAWLVIAVLLAIGSAINFGAFDSRVVAVTRAIRLISYTGILGCVLAIVRDRGASESLSLTLSGFIVVLIFVYTVTYPQFRE